MNLHGMTDIQVQELIATRNRVRQDRMKSLALISQQGLSDLATKIGLFPDEYPTDIQLISAIAYDEYPDLFALAEQADLPDEAKPVSPWFQNGDTIAATPASPSDYPDITGLTTKATDEEARQAELFEETFKSRILFTLQKLNSGGTYEAYTAIKELCQDMDWETDLERDWDDPAPTYTEAELEFNLRTALGGLLQEANVVHLLNAICARRTLGEDSETFIERLSERRDHLTGILDAGYVERQIRRYMANSFSTATIQGVVDAGLDTRPEFLQLEDPARNIKTAAQVDREASAAQTVVLHHDPVYADEAPSAFTAVTMQTLRPIQDRPQA